LERLRFECKIGAQRTRPENREEESREQRRAEKSKYEQRRGEETRRRSDAPSRFL
jgi:hypothetical protein